MGLPSVLIQFNELGITAIKRGQRGIVALILKDKKQEINPISIITVADIPTTLSAENKEQIELVLMGYQTPPKKVIIYVIEDKEEKSEKLKGTKDLGKMSDIYVAAQKALEGMKWDYIAVPSIEDKDVMAFATWIKSLRDVKEKKVKAILPNCAADHEGVINFTSNNIATKTKIFTTRDYCARMAGIIAGTSTTVSCTFAPLAEVIDCDNSGKEETGEAIDKGQLVLYNDGHKVKIARAVNSFTTTIEGKGDSFKKIKIIDAMDLIHDDIKLTLEDNYLGKYSNSYDNKCLVLSAIQGYYDNLELDGILDKGKNSIVLDIERQKAYLKSEGIDVEEMSDLQIKEANTKDQVFLLSNIKILDAIEDITIRVNI